MARLKTSTADPVGGSPNTGRSAATRRRLRPSAELPPSLREVPLQLRAILASTVWCGRCESMVPLLREMPIPCPYCGRILVHGEPS